MIGGILEGRFAAQKSIARSAENCDMTLIAERGTRGSGAGQLDVLVQRALAVISDYITRRRRQMQNRKRSREKIGLKRDIATNRHTGGRGTVRGLIRPSAPPRVTPKYENLGILSIY